MKIFLHRIIIILFIINTIKTESNLDESSSDFTFNQYKNSLTSQNSLFAERNSPDRISYSTNGMPYIPKNNTLNISKENIPEERKIGERIVDYYYSIFNYLDKNPVNNLLTSKELCEGFEDFNWPIPKEEKDRIDKFCDDLINKFDQKLKNSINFVEFVNLMEYLWKIDENKEEYDCKLAVKKSIETLENVFDFLDRDNDGYLVKEDIKYGLSRIMLKDVNLDELEKIFSVYDPNNFGKIGKEDFIVSIANGMLDDTLYDDGFTFSFLK